MRTRFPIAGLVVLLEMAVAAAGSAPAVATSPSPGATLQAGTAATAADVLTYRGGASRDGSMPGPGPVGQASVAWVFQAGGPFASQPMVQDGVVYAVSNEGTLHAVDLATGTERWSAALDTDSTGSPLLLDGHVLVATNDGLRSIAMADGSMAWKTKATQPLKGSPVPTAGHVVVAAEDGTVNAVDPATGAILWTASLGAGVDTSSAATDDTVVVGTQTGQVVAPPPPTARCAGGPIPATGRVWHRLPSATGASISRRSTVVAPTVPTSDSWTWPRARSSGQSPAPTRYPTTARRRRWPGHHRG